LLVDTADQAGAGVGNRATLIEDSFCRARKHHTEPAARHRPGFLETDRHFRRNPHPRDIARLEKVLQPLVTKASDYGQI